MLVKFPKVCPRCQIKADDLIEVQVLFGFRSMKPGKDPVPQSHCRKCRRDEGKQQRQQEKTQDQMEQALLDVLAKPSA